MKTVASFRSKRSLVIFALITFLTLQGTAQITITNSDMPSPGDTIRRSLTADFLGIDYTLAGPDYYWDFTALEPFVQTVDTFVTVSSVPFLYQLIFNPSVANLAQKFTEIDTIPELPISDPYRFFLKSSASFNDVGYAITATGIPVPLRLNPADVVYKFPVAYGNADSSDASGQLSLPGFGYVGVDRKRVNEVDGWGVLSTPYGLFDVVRLKSEVFETDTIYINELNFGTSIERNYIEYKWLANGFGAPVLQVTQEGPTVQVSYVDSIQGTTVGIHRQSILAPAVHIAPNPASDHAVISLHIAGAEHVKVVLLDINGRQVSTIFEGLLPKGRHLIPFNISENAIADGAYIIKVTSGNTISTQKMIIHRP